MIGREKDPSNSEVARLIQDSIEMDQRRAEAQRAREMLQKRQNLHHEDEDEDRSSYAEDQQPQLDHSAVWVHSCTWRVAAREHGTM